MTREFPFINEDAEGIRDGNRAIEKKLRAEICNKDYINTLKCEDFLALDGIFIRYNSDTSWHLSSIHQFQDRGANLSK